MSDIGRYRRVYTRIWRDPRFTSLTDHQKLVTLYVLSGPQGNRIGLCSFSIATAAEDLNLDADSFAAALTTVTEVFGWRFDARTRVLLIPHWWKWNPPENVNVMKGNLRDLGEIPEGPLVYDFARNVEFLLEHLRPIVQDEVAARFPGGNVAEPVLVGRSAPSPPRARLGKRLPKRMGERLPKRSPIQDQEQDQEQDQKQEQEVHALTRSVADLREGFEAFWANYPKQKDRQAAWQIWRRLRPDATLLATMIAALDWQRRQDEWLRERGRFIPKASTWLTHRRWEDEPTKIPTLSDRTISTLRAGEEFLKS